ncbi:MAG: hypothetical protein ACRCZD_10985 [Phycicoccus sp.]
MSEETRTLVLRGSSTWKTNEIAGAVSGFTTLTADDVGLHFQLPALTLRVLASAEYRATLVDDTVSYRWTDVKRAEYAWRSVVFRVKVVESLRFSPGPSRVPGLVEAVERRGVAVTRRRTTIGWGFSG